MEDTRNAYSFGVSALSCRVENSTRRALEDFSSSMGNMILAFTRDGSTER